MTSKTFVGLLHSYGQELKSISITPSNHQRDSIEPRRRRAMSHREKHLSRLGVHLASADSQTAADLTITILFHPPHAAEFLPPILLNGLTGAEHVFPHSLIALQFNRSRLNAVITFSRHE